MQDNDRLSTRLVPCPNCGAPNPASARHCSACGSRLPEVTDPDEGTVIDVSSGQPHVLEDDPTPPFGSGRVQGGFTTVRMEQGRMFVSQGGSRTCLLIAAVALVLFCCGCWFLWSIPDLIF